MQKKPDDQLLFTGNYIICRKDMFMRKFNDLALSIAALLVSYGVYKLSGLLLNSLNNDFLADFLQQGIFAVMVFLSVLVLRKTWIYHSDLRKLKVGWTAGLVMLIPLSAAALQAFAMISDISVTGFELILFVARMLLIGFCEEALFRGLIQNDFHNIFGENSTLRVFLGVICGALCFGAIHLGNALKPEVSLSAAAVQSVFTFFSGILFATVYFRTGKNLWFVVLVHAIDDFFAFIAAGRLSGSNEGQAIVAASSATNSGPLQLLFAFCFYSAISLFLLRPKKIRQLQEL